MDLTGIGALVAVLTALGGVLKLVLDHLARSEEKHSIAIKEMQERQEKFLGNHMSGFTKAQTQMLEELKLIRAESRKYHEGDK